MNTIEQIKQLNEDARIGLLTCSEAFDKFVALLYPVRPIATYQRIIYELDCDYLLVGLAEYAETWD